MARCYPGDRVICHIKDGKIVSNYEDKWEDKDIFDIISLYEEGYIIYVPGSIFLKETISIDRHNHKKYNLDKKFIDSTACFISDYKVVSIYSKIDGMPCIRCKEFFNMAEPNQADGTLLCWSCTKYPFYR